MPAAATETERDTSTNGNGTHPDGLDADEASARAEDLIIEAGGQVSMDVGGKRPTGSTLRLVGGRIEVEGQFKKGSTVQINLDVTIGEVSFVDIRDGSTGQVVGCERRHKARIVGVSLGDD